ncbi:MAG TPA: cytochrome P450 [Solirubrobacteraceae bacterium]|nr:cytochrome P450 [Solirubrobacteraceae bacterium]
MSATIPPPPTSNPLRRIATDLRTERRSGRAGRRLPPGPTNFSVSRTRAFARDPLQPLLDCYAQYGPTFTVRILHQASVFMLGPAANHYITLSHPEKFHYREGSMGDLMPLLGDGLLTLDGPPWRRHRRIVLPAFHHERLAGMADTMAAESEQALTGWREGERLDFYAWARRLSLRVAMRALFGLDPDASSRGVDIAAEFERALSFYGRDYFIQALRGPGTPWARMQAARRRLDRVLLGEIARRRGSDEGGGDILSMLLQARDEDDSALSDGQVRDEMMTLLFAGHDTTTSTVSFMFYELARHPDVAARLVEEQDRVLAGRAPTAAELMDALPQLDMVVDEVLRLYPPAWIGPRRAVEEFEFEGHTVPARTMVNYCSWASHRLPDVFADPEAFVPERFSPENRAQLPKGAYVPFGGGSRTCVGMRFGQLEVKVIATAVLQRHRLGLEPGYDLSIRQMPTLSPRHGLPVIVRPRA